MRCKFLFVLLSCIIQSGYCDDYWAPYDQLLNQNTDAITIFEKKANKGDEWSALLLGMIYYDGVIVEKNERTSKKFLGLIEKNEEILGNKFYLLAQWELDKEMPNNKFAISLLRKAIQHKDVTAGLILGMLLLDSNNNEEALKYFIKALNGKIKNRTIQFYTLIRIHDLKPQTRDETIGRYKEEIKQLLPLIEGKGFPVQYLLYTGLIKYKALTFEPGLIKTYKLLSKDISYMDEISITGDVKVNNTARNYLIARATKYEDIETDQYGYCNKYSESEYYKCLRLSAILIERCDWFERLKKYSENFYKSKYFNSCRDNAFSELKTYIQAW